MRVLCAGLAVCDILVKPVTADSLARDTTAVEQIVLAGGGDAYNVACNLAALGVGASLVTRVGDDELGGWLLNQARSRGLADAIIVRRDARTSASIVAIHPDGERSFFSCKGACHAMTGEDITDHHLAAHDVFYLGSAFDLPKIDDGGLATLLERAKTRGLFTVLDVTTDLTPAHMDVLRPALPHVSLFMPSQGQALGLTSTSDPEQAARRFRKLGCETVVVKLGGDGCLVLTGDDDRCIRLPAYRANVVDTTGAGDAFVSGYLAAHVRGLSPADCARHGNGAGSIAVSALGANGALKDFQQLVRIVGQS